MGYYTDFRLEFNSTSANQIQTRLEELSGYSFTNSSRTLCLDSAKWYDYDAHMKQLASEYPDVLFTLYGDGEERGDIWVQYYQGSISKGGKASLVYPSYGEAK